MTTTLDTVTRSYQILDSLRLENNLYLASASDDYHFVWLRDSFYECLPYLDKDDGKYEETYHAMLDILNDYAWKFNHLTMQKPRYAHEYIHPRYTEDGKESWAPWGNCQHDAIGAILWGIAMGEKAGKNILRDDKDCQTVQDLVWYLDTCEYWRDEDNGMWEEGREVHLSSLGAVVAGLSAIKDIVQVPNSLIEMGQNAIAALFPNETPAREHDLAQLSLIYPYQVLSESNAAYLVWRIEQNLLRASGVIRYAGDSYYSTEGDDRSKGLGAYIGKEAEWTFGLPWLALCHLQLGNRARAEELLRLTEDCMIDGKLPELYYAHSRVPNGNCPLGWSNALYIIAKEKHVNTFAE